MWRSVTRGWGVTVRRIHSLHEVVRALHILKGTILDFVREQGMGRNALELYAEEELNISSVSSSTAQSTMSCMVTKEP